LVLFDGELSPGQIKRLEEELNVRIVDRTILILNIFTQRARSREGVLQVELARLEYKLPRLTGKGQELSRLGGGIGTRGAGEQKLEIDRRYLRRRIVDIKNQLEKVKKTRELQRKRRQRTGIKVVSLVGYTNAGKSSLFNALCRSGHSSGVAQVEANERLFHTLDTTTRKIKLDTRQDILISDTVGFINRLPHYLVAAFRSTLEEAIESDLLLHIVDASDPEYQDKIRVVEDVLAGLGANKEYILTVFNKIDLLKEPLSGKNHIYVSAKTGEGIEELKERIKDFLSSTVGKNIY